MRYREYRVRLKMRLAVFVKFGAIDTFIRSRMRFQSTEIDFRTTLDTHTIVALIHTSQRGGYLGDLRLGLIAQSVNNLAILEFFGAFLRIGVVTAPQVRLNTVQPSTQFALLLLQLLTQNAVRVLRHSRYSSKR